VRRNYFPGDWVSYVVQRYVSALAQGFDVLYLATPYGVARFQTVSQRFLPPLTASSGLEDPRILRIAFDEGTGQLWVDTPLGPYSLVAAINQWQPERDFPAYLQREDAGSIRYDNLFVPWGLFYHPADNASPHGQFVDQQLRNYPIVTALRDVNHRDRVYIGTWGMGPGEVDNLSRQTAFYPYGPHQLVVQALHRDGDVWYMAGRGAGDEPPVISQFNTTDSSWSYLEPFYTVAASGDVTAITSLDEFVFFGTPFGLLKYDRAQDRWRKYGAFDGLPDQWITALYPDSNLLWVGTARGPGLLDPRADTGQAAISLATGTLGTPFVHHFARAWGYIWAGTQTGLYRIRQAEGDWTRIATREGLLRGQVRRLVPRPEGLWCATDAGLLLIDSLTEPRETFRSRVELTDGDLFTLAVDSYNIWAGSRAGVWRYNRAKSSWRLYTRGDGLLDDFVFDIRLDGDFVWFGTLGGVTRFYWNNAIRAD
jgi:hypothetical protein